MSQLSVRKPRPKHLDLKEIRLPLPGVVSILHRISGAGLFLFLPFLIYLLDLSLDSAESFKTFASIVDSFFVKLILMGLLWAYLHHFCAGIRFLLLDMHKGVDLPSARKSSKVVLGISLALTLIIGVVLW